MDWASHAFITTSLLLLLLSWLEHHSSIHSNASQHDFCQPLHGPAGPQPEYQNPTISNLDLEFELTKYNTLLSQVLDYYQVHQFQSRYHVS